MSGHILDCQFALYLYEAILVSKLLKCEIFLHDLCIIVFIFIGSYIAGHEHYIDVISSMVEIHSTMKVNINFTLIKIVFILQNLQKDLPVKIVNHGVMQPKELLMYLSYSIIIIIFFFYLTKDYYRILSFSLEWVSHMKVSETIVMVAIMQFLGPGPLEALANGCIYIQPRFKFLHNRQNTVRLNINIMFPVFM